eukprot:TRINITY_DN13357_c0_g1_i1.p1 TRINITY_DN13357_c0_g1~~TRINITY_DN13357_c0_g1_i1.p1  ORF type:complete len:1312 (+),score=245.90 TRINITY_DN13357_c0_g1_i1:109-4044(+)
MAVKAEGAPSMQAKGDTLVDIQAADASSRRPSAPSLLSRRLALWVWAMVLRGRSRALVPEDIPLLGEANRAQRLAQGANTLWEKELKTGKPSLARLFWRLNRLTLLAGLASSISHGLLVAGMRPLLLRQVISSVEAQDVRLEEVLGLTLVYFIEALLQMWNKQFLADDLCISVMAVSTSLVSKRIPITSDDSETAASQPEAEGKKPAEKLVAESTLIGNDLIRTMENSMMLMQLPTSCVQLTCGITVLIYVLGLPGLFGVAVAATTMMIATVVSKINKRNDKHGLETSDLRIRQLRQILEGIRFIKVSAWEPSYFEESERIRSMETVHQRRYRTLEMANATLGRTAPAWACMATFVGMVLLGEPLEAKNIFAAVSIFLTLRLPMGVIPHGTQLLLSIHNSLKRMSRTLEKPEVPRQSLPDPHLAASLRDVDLYYASSATPVLLGLTMDVPWGKLIGVIGAVGSGKSTLLQGLLGGLVPRRGVAARCQQLTAYVPQRPVVFSGPILNNITMGHELDEERLSAALSGAQFERDLELLPHGLSTEIGERGTTLSGGQQTRLNLARALYHNPALLIADDILAAVDVHVASCIFEALIAWREASEERAVVLATNALHLFPSLDHVVYLEEGCIQAQGAPAEVEKNIDATPQLKDLRNSARLAVSFDHATQNGDSKPMGEQSSPQPDKATQNGDSKPMGEQSSPQPDKEAAARNTRATLASRITTSPGGLLVQAEKRGVGAFKASVPLSYVRAIGPFWTTAYIVCVLWAYLSLAANDWWLTLWVNSASDGSASLNGAFIYACLTATHALGMVATNVVSGFAGAHASKNLHHQCLQNVLRAPVSWFEETPSGRTISRMSNDIGSVDLRLPSLIDHACQMVLAATVTSVSICVVVPWMGIFIAVIAPLFAWLDTLVNRSSREAKRITNTALSPVLTLLQESTSSRLLVRVMGQEAWLHDQLLTYIDDYNSGYYASQSLLSFLRCMGNMIGVVVSFSFCMLIWGYPDIMLSTPGGTTGVALALTYALVLPYFMSFISMFCSMTRIFLASLERLLELKSLDVPQEQPWTLKEDPPSTWPAGGKVEFRGATMRYRPQLPPAVDGLSLTIAAGERLGIVGRTGAGKSSLSVMLFRQVELEAGSILIDDVDVAKIGLHTLRRSIAMVPQDPFLFQGTIRKNLDPIDMHSDEELLSALQCVGWKDAALEADVGAGGGYLSAGERQLVAIARATLSRTRVVLMDEPTAACDAKTDENLQAVVASAFAGRTLLCIAHRLNTIMGYDRVLVMEAGSAVELDSPDALVADPSSRFAQMVAKMADHVADA